MFKNSSNIDWVREILPYLSTILLSAWGGIVNYLTNINRKGEKFSLMRLAGELVIASFAGIITFFMCSHTSMPDSLAAALIAISGHMGTRAVQGFESVYKRIFNIKE